MGTYQWIEMRPNNKLRIWKECIKLNMKKNWKLMISLKVVVGRSLVVKQLEILPILVRPIFKLEASIIHPGKNPEKVMNENYSFLSLVRLNYPSRKRKEKLRES